MDKKLEFLERVIALCREYGLCVVSDDPYECIDIAEFDSANLEMYDDLHYYYLNNG